MKVAVVGSRTYPRPDLVARFVWRLATQSPNTVIVTGGAHGPDAWAAHLAEVYGLPEPIIFRPDWQKFGRKAGFMRNTQIVLRADVVVAFWDRQSRGTLDSMEKARMLRKPCLVYGPEGDTFEVRL